MKIFKRLKQRNKRRTFKTLLAPIASRFKQQNILESRGDRPLQMTFNDQLKALIYLHLMEHVSAREMLQAFEQDDFAKECVAPPKGIKKSSFFEAINNRGLEQLFEVFDDLVKKSGTVCFPSEYRKEPEKIPNIPIVLPGGGVVALSPIADIHYDTGASFIYRENYRKFIPIKFSVVSNDLGGTVAKAQALTRGIKLPDGYYLEWSGMFNEMKKSFQRFMISIPVALFLILTALYLLYRSVRNVLITMAAPLFAVFAGLLGLLIMDESLSVSSMVGFISIIGVSILNSSIIISHYIRLATEGKTGAAAIMETARDKFRPVLMGGFVAALGLLPASMAHGIGSQVQRPLAIVVVGGMLVGTVMILMVMPVLLQFVYVEE